MKKQIELSIEKARELYSQGNKQINDILEENFSKEELTKPSLPERWEDLELIRGAYVTPSSDISSWSSLSAKKTKPKRIQNRKTSKTL